MRTIGTLPVLTVLALTLAAAPGPQSDARLVAATTSCPNPLPHEPLVLYEVVGGTLTGTVDGFLAVYGDGTARYSSSTDGSGPGSSQTVSVGAAAAALHQDLIQAGALSQCDQPDIVNDVPLSSLTVFRPSGRRASTFSWFLAEGNVSEIESLLTSFIGAHFDLPPSGGGS